MDIFGAPRRRECRPVMRGRLVRPAVVPATAVLLVLLTLLLLSGASAAPQVDTDKVEYGPNETVVITGTGFVANTFLDAPVIRPDGSIVRWNGSSFVPGWDTVNSNPQGEFNYSYLLETMYGEYEVRVYPS